MNDEKLLKFLNFVLENNNFKFHNINEIAEEKFGWQIFLNGITELENLNLVTENQDGETYSITNLGREKLSELKIKIENSEKDEKAERKKLHNESKLYDWQVKTFWWIFGFAVIGTGLSIYNFINSLTLSKDATQQEYRITKMESELSKLNTLISDQKKDTLLTHPDSKKGK
jgi:hypothetical protein